MKLPRSFTFTSVANNKGSAEYDYSPDDGEGYRIHWEEGSLSLWYSKLEVEHVIEVGNWVVDEQPNEGLTMLIGYFGSEGKQASVRQAKDSYHVVWKSGTEAWYSLQQVRQKIESGEWFVISVTTNAEI